MSDLTDFADKAPGIRVEHLEITDTQEDDASLVRGVYYAALDAIGANVAEQHPDIDVDLYDLSQYYPEKGRCFFLVGRIDDQVVATGGLVRLSDVRAEIKRLAVHPSHQRRGLGRLMLREIENRAQELGYTELVLDTTSEQEAANRLYAKEGYELTRESAGERNTTFFYFKRLNQTEE